MSIKSFLNRFKKQKITQSNEVVKVEEPKEVITLNYHAFNLKASNMVKDIPTGEYMIIENYSLYDVRDSKTYRDIFVFAKYPNNSTCKVDDIFCYGKFRTLLAKSDSELSNNDTIWKIVDFDDSDKSKSLRDINNTYFQNGGELYSLFNFRFNSAYRITPENVICNFIEDKNIINNDVHRVSVISQRQKNDKCKDVISNMMSKTNHTNN